MTGAPRSRARRLLGAHRVDGRDAEAGQSLVELMVTVAILAIALTMVMTIVLVVTKQTSTQYRRGTATETNQVTLSGLQTVFAGVVTPALAYTAAAPQGGTTEPCWGTTDPQPAPQDSAYTGEKWDSVAIIYARDFDMEFCAFPANGTSARVFEVYLTSCQNTVVGNCTLDVAEFPAGYSTADYPSVDTTHAQADAHVVESLTHVWCDQACQGGWACSSYTSGAPPSCSSTAAANTPPLLSYYGQAGSAGHAVNNPSTPMDLAYTGATDDAPNLLQNQPIADVVLQVVQLTNPRSTTAPTTSAPGVDMRFQAQLLNEQNAANASKEAP